MGSVPSAPSKIRGVVEPRITVLVSGKDGDVQERRRGLDSPSGIITPKHRITKPPLLVQHELKGMHLRCATGGPIPDGNMCCRWSALRFDPPFRSEVLVLVLTQVSSLNIRTANLMHISIDFGGEVVLL